MGLCLFYVAMAQSAETKIIEYKNQKKSRTQFDSINISDTLSFIKWKHDSDEKDRYPDWENRLNEKNNKELVGHFFQCVGTCHVDRGESFFNPLFRSRIYEGDEVQTFKDSYAWIFLLDGTIVRLAPESSISLNEINIGIKENFIHARINAGDVLWLSRTEDLFEENNSPETDALFFPLSLYEAEPEREVKKYEEDNLIELVEEKNTTLNQYKKLNELIKKNNEEIVKHKPTYAFLVLPTITLMGYSPSVEMVSLLGSKSFIKKKSSQDLGLLDGKTFDLEYQLRGFDKKEINKIEDGKWFEVEEKGKAINEVSNSLLVVGEFVTKRIPSLLVARELMLKTFSNILFQEKYDRLNLATEYGYRLWGKLDQVENANPDDLSKRLTFLKEYSRRIETTNLVVSSHFREKMQERGETFNAMEYGRQFFIRALDKYFSYVEYTDDKENGDELNSVTKKLWKQMHGIK
jgi:hypothetical protein